MGVSTTTASGSVALQMTMRKDPASDTCCSVTVHRPQSVSASEWCAPRKTSQGETEKRVVAVLGMLAVVGATTGSRDLVKSERMLIPVGGGVAGLVCG